MVQARAADFVVSGGWRLCHHFNCLPLLLERKYMRREVLLAKMQRKVSYHSDKCQDIAYCLTQETFAKH